MSANERAQHLREFEADGPDKVRENVSLNRYDRRTLARAVLWLQQRDRGAALATSGSYQGQSTASIPRRRTSGARKSLWIVAATAVAAIIAAAAFFLGRFAA